MSVGVILAVVVSVVAAALGGVAIWRTGKAPTVETALQAVSEGLSDIEKVAGAAKQYVAAAEQLWKTERLDKEGRLGYALDRLVKAFPGIPKSTLIDSIEAAVKWLKIAEAQSVPAGAGSIGTGASDGVAIGHGVARVTPLG